MEFSEDSIADIVIGKFDALPSKSKPVVDINGVSGWVPLSGIVFTNGITLRESLVLLQLIFDSREWQQRNLCSASVGPYCLVGFYS